MRKELEANKVDFESYVSRRAPFNMGFRLLMQGLLIIQIITIGLSFPSKHFWDNERLDNSFLSLFSYITLIGISEDIMAISILFLVYIIFLTISIITYLFSIKQYNTKRLVPLPLVKVYKYSSVIVYYYLFPVMCNVIGNFVGNKVLFNIKNSVLTVFIWLIFILSIVRDLSYSLHTNGRICFREQLFYTWCPHMPIRYHTVYSINAFIIGLTDLPKNGIILSHYVSLFFTIYLLYNELSLFTWINPTYQCLILSANFISTFCTLYLSITPFFKDITVKYLYVAFYCSCILGILFSILIQRITVNNSMKRLDNPNYIDLYSPRIAYKDHVIGLIYGHPNAINSKFMNYYSSNYRRNPNIMVFACRTSLFFNKEIPITPLSIIGYYPVWEATLWNIITTLMDHLPEIVQQRKEKCEKLTKAFVKVINLMEIIEQSILDESLATMPANLKQLQRNVNRLTRDLSTYLMSENDENDKRFFFDLYSSILPGSSDVPKLKYLLEQKDDYLKDFLSTYPAHYRVAIHQPDCYRSFKGCTSQYIPYAEAERVRELAEPCKQRCGVTSLRVVHPWVLFGLSVILSFTPLIGMLTSYLADSNSILDLSRSIQNTTILFVHLTLMNYPMRAPASENYSAYWDLYPSGDFLRYYLNYSLYYLDSVDAMIAKDHNFAGFPSVEREYPYLGGNFSLLYALQTASILVSVMPDKEYIIDDDGSVESLLNFMDLVFQIVEEISKAEGELIIIESFGVGYAVIWVVLFVIYLLLFYADTIIEHYRIQLFLISLKDTSKSEIVRSKQTLKEIGTNLGNFFLNRRIKYRKDFRLFVVIAFQLLSLLMLVLYFMVDNCKCEMFRNRIGVYKWATDRLFDISNFVKHYLKDETYECKLLFNHASLNYSVKFCQTCEITDVLFGDDPMGYGTMNYIDQWPINRSVTRVPKVELIYEFFTKIENPWTEKVSEIQLVMDDVAENLEISESAIFFCFIVFNIISAIFGIVLIRQIWHPAHCILLALSSLPYGTIPAESLNILNMNQIDLLKKKSQQPYTYYDAIFQGSADAVIICSRGGTIIKVNNAAHNLFFRKKQTYLMGPLNQISPCFKIAHTGQLLTEYVMEFIVDSAFQPDIINVIYVPEGKDTPTYFYEVSLLPLYDDNNFSFVRAQHPTCFAILSRDLSEEVHQRQMAEDETKKHMQIIRSILPPELALTIMNRRESISFSVDQVAISFCDIVSFTPWCASQTATDVVQTLNLMFTYFDEKRSMRPAVTKIKCIGDCYMAAAGIFGEKENAWSDIVYFCLDMIDAIGMVNMKMGTKLQVRVGAALGGPISAGVMGIEKPSFDIWGPVVNEAQAMESGGVAMNVHINAALYERVRDLPLSFRQREDGTWLIQKKVVVEEIILGDDEVNE